MTQMKWFPVFADVDEREGLESRLLAAGFSQQGEEYRDAQERFIRIDDVQVYVGIPVSDIVSEQEQLEFLVGVLGLDEDKIQGV